MANSNDVNKFEIKIFGSFIEILFFHILTYRLVSVYLKIDINVNLNIFFFL